MEQLEEEENRQLAETENSILSVKLVNENEIVREIYTDSNGSDQQSIGRTIPGESLISIEGSLGIQNIT